MRRAASALLLTALAAMAADTRRSGFDDLSPALQALQRDDTQNPGQLWVQEGQALWSRAPAQGRACVACHATDTLPPIAASFPRFDPAAARPLTLSASIDRCRVRHQHAAVQGPDGAEVLAHAAYLGHLARGRPLQPDTHRALDAWQARGETLYRQRLGQLDLACLHCHDQRAGLRLGGARIPQGHPTGYPAYRLEWQALGSLQRRLRNCVTGVRAEAWAPQADEWLALEVYLARRAAGMALEVPAVRP
ncbi:sulfur oxidation c-type cytochrome SoxA [Aquincola sp. S2]|uniref:L-cysteine S-thiosulfotransferase subunit SoxA n=1 Tax=Pseudaquabacterium terrae TaxID=2732868 RepID=A0ABX2EL85_9BURK|nr:sulfur oxidation c-type cytochrome SoxA [Aquabacterium terrae]NRF69326.1 sulfur oxidation c-type cytochrome SoxA [Aquabacterium terrae]